MNRKELRDQVATLIHPDYEQQHAEGNSCLSCVSARRVADAILAIPGLAIVEEGAKVKCSIDHMSWCDYDSGEAYSCALADAREQGWRKVILLKDLK